MTPDQELGQGDLLPSFPRQLYNEDRSVPDLTGKTVTCRVLIPGCCGNHISETTPTLVEPRAGYVQHDWIEVETREPGILRVYFLVTAPAEDPVAYPFWGYYTVRVLPRLG